MLCTKSYKRLNTAMPLRLRTHANIACPTNRCIGSIETLCVATYSKAKIRDYVRLLLHLINPSSPSIVPPKVAVMVLAAVCSCSSKPILSSRSHIRSLASWQSLEDKLKTCTLSQYGIVAQLASETTGAGCPSRKTWLRLTSRACDDACSWRTWMR